MRRKTLVPLGLCLIAFAMLQVEAPVHAADIPALVNARAQFYNFLRDIAQGEGLEQNQNVILNSTILPLDISADTPFYNDQLFRQYADRTFSGGVEGLHADSAAFLSARFSSQYRAVMNIAVSKIDQNHPEIAASMTELRKEQNTATTNLTGKLNDFDQQWQSIAASRGLTAGTVDYELQHSTWLAQVRFSDQIQTYTDDLDRINSTIDATRRRVYSAAEIAALDNFANLSQAYNVARPWTANVERSFARGGTPLTELFLSDPRRLPPSMFDSSPLVFPVGDLIAFLSNNGTRAFDTSSYSYALTDEQKSWAASGGGSFLGFSLGGGASGSSHITTSMSHLSAANISFKNVAEYLADRSAWFNPGVLQADSVFKLVQDRPELNKLGYVAVSLIIARGTTIVLKFSDTVSNTDFSQSSFAASGGASFLGFSFGASGGSSNSSYKVSVSADHTTVTIQDDDKVTRVLGVRVEPFMVDGPWNAAPLQQLLLRSPSLKADLDLVRTGKMSYLAFQKKRAAAASQRTTGGSN